MHKNYFTINELYEYVNQYKIILSNIKELKNNVSNMNDFFDNIYKNMHYNLLWDLDLEYLDMEQIKKTEQKLTGFIDFLEICHNANIDTFLPTRDGLPYNDVLDGLISPNGIYFLHNSVYHYVTIERKAEEFLLVISQKELYNTNIHENSFWNILKKNTSPIKDDGRSLYYNMSHIEETWKFYKELDDRYFGK